MVGWNLEVYGAAAISPSSACAMTGTEEGVETVGANKRGRFRSQRSLCDASLG